MEKYSNKKKQRKTNNTYNITESNIPINFRC